MLFDNFTGDTLKLYVNSIYNHRIRPLCKKQFFANLLIVLFIVVLIFALFILVMFLKPEYEENWMKFIAFTIIIPIIIKCVSLYSEIKEGLNTPLKEYLGQSYFEVPKINIRQIIIENSMFEQHSISGVDIKPLQITYEYNNCKVYQYQIDIESGYGKNSHSVFKGFFYKIESSEPIKLKKDTRFSSDIKIISACKEEETETYYILASSKLKLPPIPKFITKNKVVKYYEKYIETLSLSTEPIRKIEF